MVACLESESDPKTWLNRDSGWLIHEYAAADKLPLRFYMEVGTWEGTLMNLPNRTLRDALRAKGYPVEYREFIGGHDYICWRASLPQGLKVLMGR